MTLCPGSRPRGLLGPCTHLPPLALQPTHTLLTPFSPHSRANDKSRNKTKPDIKRQSKYINTCEGLRGNQHKNRLFKKLRCLREIDETSFIKYIYNTRAMNNANKKLGNIIK